MKNIKLSGYEIYLLQESLKNFKSLVLQENFPKNSIITKEYIECTIAELEEKLCRATIKEKVKLHATT